LFGYIPTVSHPFTENKDGVARVDTRDIVEKNQLNHAIPAAITTYACIDGKFDI
jgi:hypothetical protein